jgi:hypothetical protein
MIDSATDVVQDKVEARRRSRVKARESKRNNMKQKAYLVHVDEGACSSPFPGVLVHVVGKAAFRIGELGECRFWVSE